MIILFLATIIVTFNFVRTVLVITGLYKDPILRAFEKYGGDEDYYYPLPPFAAWLGAFLIVTDFWFTTFLGNFHTFTLIGGLLIVCAAITSQYPEIMNDRPQWFLVYTRWLYEIRERTTRHERRRLAYMWLRLPWKLRVIYNSNEAAFNHWADMVILSTRQ